MPAMNGWEFLDKYQEMVEENKHKIIIIMLTTSLNPDDKSKAAGLAVVSGFYIKPLTPELLESVMNEFFIYEHKLK